MTSVLDKNAGKAFIHRTKIYCLVTKLYEVFNRLQAFLYFLLWGIKVGIERKHIFHSWLHRALEDKTVSSVNTDLGAEACSVLQDHLSSFREMFQISHPL